MQKLKSVYFSILLIFMFCVMSVEAKPYLRLSLIPQGMSWSELTETLVSDEGAESFRVIEVSAKNSSVVVEWVGSDEKLEAILQSDGEGFRVKRLSQDDEKKLADLPTLQRDQISKVVLDIQFAIDDALKNNDIDRLMEIFSNFQFTYDDQQDEANQLELLVSNPTAGHLVLGFDSTSDLGQRALQFAKTDLPEGLGQAQIFSSGEAPVIDPDQVDRQFGVYFEIQIPFSAKLPGRGASPEDQTSDADKAFDDLLDWIGSEAGDASVGIFNYSKGRSGYSVLIGCELSDRKALQFLRRFFESKPDLAQAGIQLKILDEEALSKFRSISQLPDLFWDEFGLVSIDVTEARSKEALKGEDVAIFLPIEDFLSREVRENGSAIKPLASLMRLNRSGATFEIGSPRSRTSSLIVTTLNQVRRKAGIDRPLCFKGLADLANQSD